MSSPQHPTASSGNSNNWRRARRAFAFAGAHRVAIALAVGLTMVVSVLASIEPLVLRALVDGLSRHAGTRALLLGSAALASILLGRETLDALASRFGWRARIGLQRALFDATVGRLHALPLSHHQGEPAGSVMTRLDRGVQGLTTAFAELLFRFLPALLYLVLSATM
ncbi:MAG TPA: ABC transporter transmembrane domain-containing protein, partial [Polyangia bacterium]|nr:ABC transporter transmembrane domain-containing protein [Polyangia bacterium]